VLDAARRDPGVLVGGPGQVTLDGVQREPGLLRAAKRAIDRDRTPGRFLLTGSTNLLLMRQASESLAGRASNLTLWPMTRREQRGLGPLRQRALARRGGFPTPALALSTAPDRSIWFDGYVRMYLERDPQDLASISALPDFRRLMRSACRRLGQLVNQAEMGCGVALPQPTVHRWLELRAPDVLAAPWLSIV